MSRNKPDTYVGKVSAEFDAATNLRKSRPWLFWMLAASTAAFGYLWVHEKFDGVPRLKERIVSLEQDLATKRGEILTLETQLAPLKTAAILKYGNAESQALAQISEDVRKFERALRENENKIRSLNVVVSFEAKMKWSSDQAPKPENWVRRGGDNREVRFILVGRDGKDVNVAFGNIDGFKFQRLNDGFLRGTYRAEAIAGSEIFGRLPEDFESVREFTFTGYGIEKGDTDNPTIFRNLTAQFYSNGVARFAVNAAMVGSVIAVADRPQVTYSLPIALKHVP